MSILESLADGTQEQDDPFLGYVNWSFTTKSGKTIRSRKGIPVFDSESHRKSGLVQLLQVAKAREGQLVIPGVEFDVRCFSGENQETLSADDF